MKKNEISKIKKTRMIAFVLMGIIIIALISYGHFYIKEKIEELKVSNEFYKILIDQEKTWLLDNQLSNGAIPFRYEISGQQDIIPYFSDFAALALLSEPVKDEEIRAVKDYIDWHFDHLNTSDEDLFGIDGTIYHYQIQTLDHQVIDEEVVKEYDSIDSYAATFLILLEKYSRISGDEEYIIERQKELMRVVKALEHTIQADGLSYVKDDYPIKYLMDNAEVNRAIKSIIYILGIIENNQRIEDNKEEGLLTSKWNDILENNTKAFNQFPFWNSEKKRFEIGIDQHGTIIKSKMKFYPDRVGQLFPSIFEVEFDYMNYQQKNRYKEFCKEYQWETLEHIKDEEATFYWSLIAYAAAQNGDNYRVKKFIEQMNEKVLKEHEYPYYIGESAWLIMACEKMIEDNNSRIEKLSIFYR